jgi:dienelactone hydrolase
MKGPARHIGPNYNKSEQKPLTATVIYYGNLVNDTNEISKIKWPVLGIFGDQDQSILVESVNAFEQALNETGITNEIYIAVPITWWQNRGTK